MLCFMQSRNRMRSLSSFSLRLLVGERIRPLLGREAPLDLFGSFGAQDRLNRRWISIMGSINIEELVDGFGKIIEDIKTFAMPAFRSLASGEKIAQQWKAGNGWVIS
jgi:hypothetical protein